MMDACGITGIVRVRLIGPRGEVLHDETLRNLVTTAGDQYYAGKGIASVSPASATAPTAVSGMKLGTGTTAAAKSGGGAALGSYIAGSNVAFDATYPQASAVGSDAGWYATYQCTWGAGVATAAAITEVVIVNDAGTNATSSAANTISRTVFSALSKAADAQLEIVWSHKLLGA
jgi:hypothetical protein